MSPQNPDEIQRLLLDALDKIPSARVLVIVVAGFSGVFSSAWWLGLDTAPDRWTGAEDREYREKHERLHARIENQTIIDDNTIKARLEGLSHRFAVDEEKLRSFNVQLESIKKDHEYRLSIHERLQEHDGASRRFEILERDSHEH